MPLKNRPSQTSSATIHKIRLQEILVALHRVYLEPDGPICNALIQSITSPIELKDALNPSASNHPQAIQLIGEALKNIISRIVDFMVTIRRINAQPLDLPLAKGRCSGLDENIGDRCSHPRWESLSGQLFLAMRKGRFSFDRQWITADRFFQQLLEFNRAKMINITKQRAILLLIGIFIFRALVTTVGAFLRANRQRPFFSSCLAALETDKIPFDARGTDTESNG